jgi:2-amino-4-hydroxy-6-hydroxymethyldihydropteridine diphosphokinase/dihydroneopterin aldolase
MQIQVNGIACMAMIGVHEHERDGKQEVIVDVACDLDDVDWQHNDKIDNTLCFDILLEHTREVIESTQYHLLESLAQHLACTIFSKFVQVKSLDIKIFKTQLCGVGASSRIVHVCEKRKFKVAVALGSNNQYLPQQQLISAIEILNNYINDIKIGGFYETKPVGFTEQRNFYNTAIIGTTTLTPEILLSKLKKTEKLMGKEEIMLDGPRIIDLDLILVDDMVYQHNFIKIPHIAMHERDFVLQPLADIEPNWRHPLLDKTVHELLNAIPQDERSILTKVI